MGSQRAIGRVFHRTNVAVSCGCCLHFRLFLPSHGTLNTIGMYIGELAEYSATKHEFRIIGSVMFFVGMFVVYVELGMLATNCLCFRALQSTIYHVFHLCTPPRSAAAVARSNRIGGSRRYCSARASPLDVAEIGSCAVRVRRPYRLSLSVDA